MNIFITEEHLRAMILQHLNRHGIKIKQDTLKAKVSRGDYDWDESTFDGYEAELE